MWGEFVCFLSMSQRADANDRNCVRLMAAWIPFFFKESVQSAVGYRVGSLVVCCQWVAICVVTFSLLSGICGECLTIHSLPAVFVFVLVEITP